MESLRSPFAPGARERERQRDRDRERQRETETDRDRERERERERHRQRESPSRTVIAYRATSSGWKSISRNGAAATATYCRYRMPDMDIANDCYIQRLSHGANIAEMETKLHHISGLPSVYHE